MSGEQVSQGCIVDQLFQAIMRGDWIAKRPSDIQVTPSLKVVRFVPFAHRESHPANGNTSLFTFLIRNPDKKNCPVVGWATLKLRWPTAPGDRLTRQLALTYLGRVNWVMWPLKAEKHVIKITPECGCEHRWIGLKSEDLNGLRYGRCSSCFPEDEREMANAAVEKAPSKILRKAVAGFFCFR